MTQGRAPSEVRMRLCGGGSWLGGGPTIIGRPCGRGPPSLYSTDVRHDVGSLPFWRPWPMGWSGGLTLSLWYKPIDEIMFEDVDEFCSQKHREGLRLDYKVEIPRDLAKL